MKLSDRVIELETALGNLLRKLPGCECNVGYLERGRVDPHCVHCQIGEQEIAAAHEVMAATEEGSSS